MNAAEKYIFLDFDGVLNTEYYQNLLYYQGKPLQDENGLFFAPEAVAQLNPNLLPSIGNRGSAHVERQK